MKERNMVILKLVIEEFDLFKQSDQAPYTGILKIHLDRKWELMTAFLQKRPVIVEHYHCIGLFV